MGTKAPYRKKDHRYTLTVEVARVLELDVHIRWSCDEEPPTYEQLRIEAVSQAIDRAHDSETAFVDREGYAYSERVLSVLLEEKWNGKTHEDRQVML